MRQERPGDRSPPKWATGARGVRSQDWQLPRPCRRADDPSDGAYFLKQADHFGRSVLLGRANVPGRPFQP
eukprot:8940940-Alexandrium_andersonii.AAC.1